MGRILTYGFAAVLIAWFAFLGLNSPAQVTGEPWRVEPGDRYAVDPEHLAMPYATRSVGNSPRRIDRPKGAVPQVPEGFTANLFADELSHARWLAVSPNGDVFLAEPGAGAITMLRDEDGDGMADMRTQFAGDLRSPHGMAFRPDAFYVADLRGVWRFPYQPGDTTARGAPEMITAPGAFGDVGGHSTRILAFAPDGETFYVAIGSAGNINVEPSPRATVQVFDKDGQNQRTFAAGLRNPVGLEFYPGTDWLYTVVNERDGMGDELVPDYLARIQQGEFFGWPYAYIGPNPQPDFAEKAPELVAETKVPDLLFLSHSAPLGLAFYDGDSFPEAYHGDAFVGLHGSWNAAKPRGYMVARVPFRDGRPEGYYEAFMTGFWAGGTDPAEVWGRPVGIAVAKDGSLLVADDAGRAIWRVSAIP